METAPRPLSWQKARHLLVGAGIFELGWKIGAMHDSDMVAVVYYPNGSKPGKRRTEKLIKALTANRIAYRQQDDGSFALSGWA